ncbi:hypothetical protein ACFQ36_02465 [Arthrobacter sp. GCM10027362]|uniref:hypothetical protein n=1 Tax=Arthrobacter sp. GCM10027362 TaxID=3273379 RepID=UPI00362B2FC2
MDEDKGTTLAAEGRIRETAKWLTVSLALLGGVLVAGTQFSSLGSIEVGTDRFLAAVLGGALAALGAGLILAAAVWTATTPPVSLQKLKAADLPKDTFLLEQRESVAKLRDEYRSALDERNDAIANNLARPTKATELALRRADIRAVHLSGIVQNVLKVASYQSVARRWKWAALIIAGGALLAFVGLMFFIWGVNPPAAAKASSAVTAVVGETATRTIRLSPVGQARLKEKLGAGCDVSKPLRVLHLDDTAAGPDVVIQQDGCKPLRIVLNLSWGDLTKPAPPAPAPAG